MLTQTLDSILEWLHRHLEYGFVYEWEDIPPDARAATLWLLVLVGALLGGAVVLALLWVQSVML